MAKINILPAKVYNRIAAGEVVERPYSVIKELVENSIDAGATEIEIYVEKGGKESIRVIDNGCGIAREDLQSAFLPHATSKIATAEDLDTVLTLGFRGEAIASIASVSHMSITSRVKDGKCYQLVCSEGVLGQIEEVPGPYGTEVCVENLFFNAPVRLKFLKTDKGEETEITNLISRMILNRPDIAFSYYANGKKIFQSFGGGLDEALVCVYNAATLRECFHIDAERHGIRVRGYIGNHNFFKANKSYQSVFLNGRYIVNGTIASAISNAYSNYLMKRQYPFYVLHIDVPREIVDVNVHPNKTDVRFVDNQIIYGCINRIISTILDGHTKALEYIVQDDASLQTEQESIATQQEIILPKKEPVIEEKPANTFGFSTLTYEEARKEIEKCAPNFSYSKDGAELPFSEIAKNNKGYTSFDDVPIYIPDDPNAPDDPGPSKRKTPHPYGAEKLHKLFPNVYFKRNKLEVDDKEEQEDLSQVDYFADNKRYLEEMERRNKQDYIDVYSCRYVGKLFNTYIMYERNDEVFIIDQHAAHERLIFNKLKDHMENRKIRQQPMLIPFEMKINAFEGDFIRERMEDITEMGFEIRDVGNNLFQITAIPMDLKEIDLASFMHGILGYINEYRKIKLVDIIKDKLASAACKAAVKGGMDLTQDEIESLFELMDGDMGLKCPHGRPVVVKMSKKELEKKFKRIV